MTVQFEVRALKDGKWLTECRSSDQNDAIRRANDVFSTMLCTGVRVIRETYVQDQGVFLEKTVYRNMGVGGEKKSAADVKSTYTPGATKKAAPPPRKRMPFTIKVVLLMCLAAAVFIALKATPYLL